MSLRLDVALRSAMDHPTQHRPSPAIRRAEANWLSTLFRS